MANALSFLVDPAYWQEVKSQGRNALAQLGKGSQGIAYGTLGAPVDIANMALKPFGLGYGNPIGGGNHLAKLMGVNPESTAYQIGSMLPVSPEGMIGSAKGIPLALAGMVGKSGKADDALKAEDTLFNTSGLENRGRDLIKSKAEEYAQRLKDAGVDVLDVIHSGSAAGPSSYIKIQGQPDLRISGHSKGVFNSQDVINIGSDSQLEDILQKLPKTVRKAMPEDYARLKQQEIDTMYPRWIVSADKKLAKGKSLTKSEQEAIDWRDSQ